MAELRRYCSLLKYVLYVHPMQYSDIERDKNNQRKSLLKSRLEQYATIDSAPILSENSKQELGLQQNKINDEIDNNLLYSVYRGAVHYLVTNDAGIHKKAKKINCSEQVLRSEQFINMLKSEFGIEVSPPAGLIEKKLYELELNDIFFDSIRNAYDGFDEWFLKCAREHRKAWCVFDSNGKLQAICILKEEKNEAIYNGLKK